jgi:hypothetical protein
MESDDIDMRAYMVHIRSDVQTFLIMRRVHNGFLKISHII